MTPVLSERRHDAWAPSHDATDDTRDEHNNVEAQFCLGEQQGRLISRHDTKVNKLEFRGEELARRRWKEAKVGTHDDCCTISNHFHSTVLQDFQYDQARRRNCLQSPSNQVKNKKKSEFFFNLSIFTSRPLDHVSILNQLQWN